MTDRAIQRARSVQRYYPRVECEMHILCLSGIERLAGTRAVTSCENSKHSDAQLALTTYLRAKDSAKLSRPAAGGLGSLGSFNI